MSGIIIKNATLVNDGKLTKKNILIQDGLIKKISNQIDVYADRVIDGKGLYLLPGIIDDQVHFREPGLTHKATISSESISAVSGGVTSFMDMPNTYPPSMTTSELQKKRQIAENTSLANYSFYIGASHHNIDDIAQCDPKTICGVKVFMGSSTGGLLVNKRSALEDIFKESPILIATHCEDEEIIQKNLRNYKTIFGDNIPINYHPLIRNDESCFRSSNLACELAYKYNSDLHVLHISTAREIKLFKNNIELKDKKITAEVCPHHLWFHDKDYSNQKSFIKCNPAIKNIEDRDALREALINGNLDIVGSDHAPHTLEEKRDQNYIKCPSGMPIVGHSLLIMLELFHDKFIDLPTIARKMSHNVAERFRIKKRGFIRTGYFADLVLVDLSLEENPINVPTLYKCGWSPFQKMKFRSKVLLTMVNGQIAYEKGQINTDVRGSMLQFERGSL